MCDIPLPSGGQKINICDISVCKWYAALPSPETSFHHFKCHGWSTKPFGAHRTDCTRLTVTPMHLVQVPTSVCRASGISGSAGGTGSDRCTSPRRMKPWTTEPSGSRCCGTRATRPAGVIRKAKLLRACILTQSRKGTEVQRFFMFPLCLCVFTPLR